MNCKKVRRLL